MRAVVVEQYGGPEVLQVRQVPEPQLGPDEIKVNVAYTALNRADLLQRMGGYPPPEPAPEFEILGLEFSGVVEEVGARVTRWQPGDKVFGLLNGGGYAEKVVIHEAMALPVPENITLAAAAGVAEVFLTAFDALVNRGRVRSGEHVLVHAGGSGVGTAAIQIARAMGATVFATVGSEAKADGVAKLGAEPILYKEQDFVKVIRQATPRNEAGLRRGTGGGIGGQTGVDVILDFIGSPYLPRNMQAATTLGRIVVIGLMGGAKGEIDLGLLLRKRLTIVGTVLRSRPLTEKLALTADFAQHVLPLLADGNIRPVIDREFPLADAAAAHEYMASNANFGKILLRVAP